MKKLIVLVIVLVTIFASCMPVKYGCGATENFSGYHPRNR